MHYITVKKRNVSRQFYVGSFDDTDYISQSFKASGFRFYADRSTYTRGQLHLVFDLTGQAIEGYSYDACLFARSEPCADFPNGRIIWNDTNYSATTNSKHRYPCMRAAGLRTSEWDARAEVLHMSWYATPNALRLEIETWAMLNSCRTPESVIERRIAERAERKAQYLARRATARVCKNNPSVISLDARRKANG